jgi:hypothetical protein
MSLISYYGKLFQVSYVAKDLDRAVEFAQQKLGVSDFTVKDVDITARFGSEIKDLRLRMAVANTENHQFEILQPVSGATSIYTDGFDYDRSVLTFHHIGIAVTGPYSNWEKMEQAVYDSGDEFAIVCPPDPEPNPMARYAYVDTRPYYGHFTEYLWWAPELNDNPAFPKLS